jgi:hypothetical protein
MPPKKMTLAESRKVVKALPKARVAKAKKVAKKHSVQGQGWFSDVTGALGSVGKELAPVVLKEVAPLLIKSALGGRGLAPAGGRKKKVARKRL